MKDKLKSLIIAIVSVNILFYTISYAIFDFILSEIGFILIVSSIIIEVLLSLILIFYIHDHNDKEC